MSKKVCGKCGVGTQFKAVIRRPAVVEIAEDGTVEIKQEGKKFKYEVVRCANCEQDITEADLVSLVKCTGCGKMVSHSAVEDGKCIDCITAERTDLAGLSQADYIKRILELEKKLNAKQGPKIDSKIEAATSAPVEEKTEEANAAATEQQTEKKASSSRSSRSKAKAEQTAPVETAKETEPAAEEVGGLTPPVLSEEDPF